jgi:hypothetical protein
MYWRCTFCVALTGFFLATAARADLLPPDGKPFYRGKIKMTIGRLPAGVVLLYAHSYNAASTTAAERGTLTIGETGTLYAVNKTLAARVTDLKKDQMYQLKHFTKFDLPVSRSTPDLIKHLSCSVTGSAASEYKLFCTEKTK